LRAKKSYKLLILALFCPAVLVGQNYFSNRAQNNNIVSNFEQFSLQQLLDTGDYYFDKNSMDTALIYYNMLITLSRTGDVEQQKKMVEAYNRAALVYYYLSNYNSSYDLLIKALHKSEEIDYLLYLPKIYTNLGNIYYQYNKYDIAKSYYLDALSLSIDTISIVVILNNLGSVEIESEKYDSAFYYLDKALIISKQYHEVNLSNILNNFASLYRKEKKYDLAEHYYRLSLIEAQENNIFSMEANNLSNFGKLFFETHRFDSALLYIKLSNDIAIENSFLEVLADNYLLLSQIAEKKGEGKKAFEYFKRYADLKDSVFNIEKFADISQMQRLYEISKTNEQIEHLHLENQINERTIHYQKIILRIGLVILLLLSGLLLFIWISFLQSKKLRKSYKMLFHKNLEIIKLGKNTTDKELGEQNKNIVVSEAQKELLDKILSIMEDVSVICDPSFTIDNLAILVDSKHNYVSHVINSVMNQNFRSFLNTYRIREAQRLLSELDTTKFSIEHIALQVGFKSRSAFREAFKDITGLNPNFYIKSLQETAKS